MSILKAATVVVFFAVCLFAYLARGQSPAGDGPAWYSIVPPLVAVTVALISNRILPSLSAAVLAGGMLSAVPEARGFLHWLLDGLSRAAMFFGQTMWDAKSDAVHSDHVRILLYIELVMAMISVMLVAGGLQGVANWLTKYARSARSTQLVTMGLGLIIFIDDYANTMIVGSTMRPVTDRQRISREKLAFLVDATAAPIAGIAIVSTWIGYEVGLLGDEAVKLGLAKGGYEMFFDAIAFRFYCLGMIALVFFNVASGQDFGPMDKAQRRAAREGKLQADRARPMVSDAMASARPHPQARVHAFVAVLPMLALLAVFVVGIWLQGRAAAAADFGPLAVLRLAAWREALGKADSIQLLVYASAIGLELAIALALLAARTPPIAVARAVLLGIRSSLVPVSVLVLAWSLTGACKDLQTGQFLARALADSLWPWVFPALVFIVAALTSFATGTSWGTMAILIPVAIPVAFNLDGGVYGLITVVSVAAVLDGAIFGDHCSPISDTTIMSSTASSCDHMAHVRTQIPYSLAAAGVALCLGYLPAAMGVSSWFGILGGATVWAILFYGLKLRRSRQGLTSSSSGRRVE